MSDQSLKVPLRDGRLVGVRVTVVVVDVVGRPGSIELACPTKTEPNTAAAPPIHRRRRHHDRRRRRRRRHNTGVAREAQSSVKLFQSFAILRHNRQARKARPLAFLVSASAIDSLKHCIF